MEDSRRDTTSGGSRDDPIVSVGHAEGASVGDKPRIFFGEKEEQPVVETQWG